MAVKDLFRAFFNADSNGFLHESAQEAFEGFGDQKRRDLGDFADLLVHTHNSVILIVMIFLSFTSTVKLNLAIWDEYSQNIH